MTLYLTPKNVGGTVAISVCQRCNTKYYYGDMQKDPNNGLWVCRECCDIFDPWRLPARKAEDISLQRPRPDVDLTTP